jgi:hypothetical protein
VELKAIMWNNNEGTLLVDYIRRRSNLLPCVTWSVVPCLSLQVTAAAAAGDAATAGAPAVVTDVSVGKPNLSSGPPSSEPAVQEAGGEGACGRRHYICVLCHKRVLRVDTHLRQTHKMDSTSSAYAKHLKASKALTESDIRDVSTLEQLCSVHRDYLVSYLGSAKSVLAAVAEVARVKHLLEELLDGEPYRPTMLRRVTNFGDVPDGLLHKTGQCNYGKTMKASTIQVCITSVITFTEFLYLHPEHLFGVQVQEFGAVLGRQFCLAVQSEVGQSSSSGYQQSTAGEENFPRDGAGSEERAETLRSKLQAETIVGATPSDMQQPDADVRQVQTRAARRTWLHKILPAISAFCYEVCIFRIGPHFSTLSL